MQALRKLIRMENGFVVGLQGSRRRRMGSITSYTEPTIKMTKGDLFHIRGDFDPGHEDPPHPVHGKGVHVNAEYLGTRGTIQLVFLPSNSYACNRRTNRSSTLYEHVIRDQSRLLGL